MKKLIKLTAVLLSLALVVSVVPIVSAQAVVEPSETVVADEITQEESAYIIDEIVEKRTETTKHFLMSDGSVMAAVYDQAVHYNDGNAWVDIDNSFSTNTDNDLENTSNVFKTKFSKKSNGNKLVTVKKDDYSLSWMLSGADKVDAQVSDSNQKEVEDKSALKNLEGYVTYPDIQQNVDLQYVVSGSDVKENIVLKDKNVPSEFKFEYKFNGLKHRTNVDGQIEFYDENDSENVVFIIDTPFMYDAERAYSSNIEMMLDDTENGFTLTLIPDKAWLLSEERVYPIVIDPTTIGSQKATSVWDIDLKLNQTSALNYKSGDFLVGSNTSSQVYRTLLKFHDLPDVGVDGIVIGANMRITTYQGPAKVGDPEERVKPTDDIQVNIHRMTADWPEQGATWSGYANSCDPIIDEYFIYNDTDIEFYADITEIVSGWYAKDYPNYGILLKAADETAANHIMQFASSDWSTNDSEFVTLRPVLYVNYRSSTGLEDYWSYTTQSMGGYGTGYVNNFNGNLTYIHNDANFVSEINGFSVSHVYNTANVNTTGTRYGKGWGINLIQTLKTATIEGNEYVKYVYTDGDGTKHYFVELDDGKIVDEDGLGYTVTTINETVDSGTTPLTHKITTKDDCVLKFDTWGFLRRVSDPNGNTINLHYSPGATTDKNYLSVVNTTSGGNIRFIYEGDQLAKIIDTAGRETTYTYDSGNLIKITYPDDTYLQYAYYSGENGVTGSSSWLHDITLPNNFKYHYGNYNNGKIYSVTTETAPTETLETIQGNRLEFKYKNNETYIKDSMGRTTTYQFDTSGRVTGSYDTEGNSYSETFTPTSETIGGIFSNNKIATASGNIKYINNLAPDGAFLNGLDSWGTYPDRNSTTTNFSVVSDQSYISSNTVKISTDDYGTHAIRKDVTTTTGKTYTLSANIKTKDVVTDRSQGAALKINTNKKTYYSEFVVGTTNTEINNGFVTLSLTPNIASDEKITSIAVGLNGANGTIWIDSVQFEEGDSANKINLVNNSSFENGVTDFTPNVTNSANGASGEQRKSGSYGLKMVGIPTDNYNYSQVISVSGKAGDVYSFGTWTRGYSISYGDDLGRYKMVCEFTYTDNTTSRETIEFNTYISDWQYGTKNIAAQKDYSKLTLYLCYNKNCNVAYYDQVFLYRDVMQSYTYDSNGNVVSTADYASQQSSYNYNGSSLSKILNPDGTSYEYGYDDKNNLAVSRSNIGLQTDIKYDSHGNPTKTIISADNYSATIQSGKTYCIRLKGTGKYLTVENADKESGTNVCQATFNGQSEQIWLVEKAINGGYYLYPQNATNKVLNVASNTQDGNVTIATHSTADTQRFDIILQSDHTYKIVAKCSGERLVTIPNAASQNNASVWTPQGELNANQSWYFEDASTSPTVKIEDGAIYSFRARHSGKYINVANATSGTEAKQYEYNSSEGQKFRVNKQEDGYYTLSLYGHDNLLLKFSNYHHSDNIPYRYLLLDSTVDDSCLFKFEYDSYYMGFQIIPKIATGYSLDVMNYSTSNDAMLIFTNKAANSNRIFIAEKVSQSITSSVTYDNDGNFVASTTDSRGNTTTYTFDTARGTQTAVTDAENNTTAYNYNPDNDRLNSVTSGNSTVSYAYDNVGALNKITSPSGTEYYLVYDDFGNLYSTSVGSRVLSENHYNTTRGLLTYTTYGNGHRIDYSYDTLDRITQRMYNNGIKVNLRYDKFGNLYELCDGFTGTTYRYSYDLTGRIIGIKGSNGTGLDYVYDNLNRVSKYATKFNDITNTTEFVYGSSSVYNQYDGLIYGIKLNGEQKLTYAYDNLARMQKRTIATTTPFKTNYTYLEGATPGTTTTMVKTIQNGNDTYEYSYDELGNITEIKLNGVVYESYEYDHLGQLTFVARGTDFYEYYYDDGGNLQSVWLNGVAIKTYTYGDATWKDLLTSFNEQTITYDNIGNPLQYRDGFNFSWSNGRQLTSVTKGNDSISYLYNADGLRTSKTVNNVTTDYYWLDGVLLGQKTGDDYIIYLYDENGTPYGIICNNTYYYYLFNAQGDVVGIIDESGAQVVSYDYSAWGEVLSITGSGANTIGQLNPIRYRGYYYDNETGFYYLQSRYYDPVTQRFLNADGLVADIGEEILGYNAFAYCFNNPVMRSDPTGYWSWRTFADNLVTAIATAVSTAVGIAVGILTYKKTDSKKKAATAGVAAGAGTFCTTNNVANAVYYNFFSEAKDIETNPEHSIYVDGYVNRWDRLDHTKYMTDETTYNFNAWRFYGEYSVHMYCWYATGWAHNKGIPLFSRAAQSAYVADVESDKLDENEPIMIGSFLWGLLGI